MKIGIDLGGSHMSGGIVENEKILNQKGQDIKDKNDIENVIIEGIKNLIKEILEGEPKESIEKIGISAPGIISDGKIIKSPNLDLHDFDLIKRLKEFYPNIEITIRNDGKCAALAEKKYGVLKDVEDAVFMNIGTGIGGAVFINNTLLVPKKSEGFEIGHMIIEKNGVQCTCGKKGCFERYASIRYLKELVRNRLNLNEITGRELREIVENNPESLKDIIDEYIENLCVGISNVIDIFEPQVICFGGSFANYEKIIIEPLKSKLLEPGRLFSKSVLPEFKMATLGNDAGIIGSVIGDGENGNSCNSTTAGISQGDGENG